MQIRLVAPAVDFYPQFEKFADEMAAHGESLWSGYGKVQEESVAEFVQRVRRRESHPEGVLVPETIYWAMNDGHVVGRISLRHRIEGNLLKIGGHIGYEVRPSFRRQGVATEMLRLVLLTEKAKEIGRLLLTCKPDNIASNKTILKNGGIFSKKIFVETVQEERNHYWIALR